MEALNNDLPIKKESRRKFIAKTGVAAFAFTILPRHVLGGTGHIAPSDKLNIAMIGTGGQGMHNLRNLLQIDDVQVIALADVTEWADYSRFYFQIPGGRKPGIDRIKQAYGDKKAASLGVYVDFREMLDKEKSIDAVVVSTPDHSHYVAALAPIQRGKPLC